jgi:hypothetical protein
VISVLSEKSNEKSHWPFLIDSVRRGECTPVISNRLMMDLIFGQQDVTGMWADECDYPMGDRRNLSSIAQFVATTGGGEYLARSAYLEFLKRTAIEESSKTNWDRELIEDLTNRIPDHSFSRIVLELLPVYDWCRDHHPLALLANIRTPLFLTTSYHTILEEALRWAGKDPVSVAFSWQYYDPRDRQSEPHTELQMILAQRLSLDDIHALCFDLTIDYENLPGESKERKIVELITFLDQRGWLPDLVMVGKARRPDIPWDDLLDVSETTPSALVHRSLAFLESSDSEGKSRIRPDVGAPLVYHLLGIDTDPSTLVLTEDDFLACLLTMSQDVAAIPPRVAQALAHSSLLLLGYEWHSWEFKIVHRGLVMHQRSRDRRLSLATLDIPESPKTDHSDSDKAAREFIEEYLDRKTIRVYWGDWKELVQSFWKDLNP